MNKHFNYVVDFDSSLLDKVNSVTTDQGRYYVDSAGSRYPSITTIMSWTKKDIIKKWRQNVGEQEANKITKQATTRGTKIHDIAEKYLSNDHNYIQESNYATSIEFEPIKEILDKSVDNIFCLEKALYSNFLGVAGRTDCIAHYNGKPAVIDFKTSRKHKRKSDIDTYFMQAAAYSIMFEELTGIAVPNIVIIMAVQNLDVVVFEEKRNNYSDQLVETINQYKMLNN